MPFSLRADWADEMLERVKEDKKQSAQSDALMAEQKRAEIEKINLRLQKLLDSFLDEIIDRDTYVAEKAKWMSQKKSLEEQSSALLKGRADWLEPFQRWILTARNAGEIAVNGSPQERKVLAQKVFGSNLVLDCKKARGSCVKPWSYLLDNSSSGGMVRARGLEPPILSEPDPKSGASAIPPRAQPAPSCAARRGISSPVLTARFCSARLRKREGLFTFRPCHFGSGC